MIRKGSSLPRKTQSGGGLAAVSMVKNECDIIELFIRINSRVFDMIYVLDHNSEDTTPEIVELLAREGLPVELTRLSEESAAYNQGEITTRFINHVAKTGRHRYIMPLDADEFLWFDPSEDLKRLLAREVPEDGCGLVPWVTYCPAKGDYHGTRAPLHSNFVPRNREPRQYHKVLVGRYLAERCVLEMGNHSLAAEGRKINRSIPLILQHVPVRGPSQITSKAVIGSRALALKANRKKGEGAHWDDIMETLIKCDMQLSDDAALRIALDYATHGKKWWWWLPFRGAPRLPLIDVHPKIGGPDDIIVHQRLAEVDWRANLAKFLQRNGKF